MRQETLSISAIILLHDDNGFLEDTVYSIQDQSYQPLEIIVIDSSIQGCMTESVKKFNEVRYYHQPGRNKAFCRNLGIQLAQGEVIAFLDSGDMWADHKLANQIKHLEEHPEAEIVQGLIQNVSRTSKYPSHIEKFALTYEFINPGSLVFRRSAFDHVGMFDETLDAGEEIDWFLRAWEINIIKAELEEITLFQRQYGSQGLTVLPQVQSLNAIKKYIGRHKEKTNRLTKGLLNSDELRSYIGNPLHELETRLEAFTIVSDDCWAYGPYTELRLRYTTPFIGIRIEAPCYLELLKDLRGYVESSLVFTETSKYESTNLWREENKFSFPIAHLKDKVELLFIHETDANACQKKWERRVKRINWNNLFIKFRENPWDIREDYLTDFDQLPYEYKVCFTLKDYPEFSWAISAPNYFKFLKEEGGNIYTSTKGYFDVLNWVKKAHGSNTAAYKVKL